MDRSDSEDVRWVLDRQKDDYRAIKTQFRRYLLAVLSATVILSGVWYNNGGILPSEEETAASLAEVGMLWQLDLATPETAEAAVDSLIYIPAFFEGIGVALFILCIGAIFRTERGPSCHPTGEAHKLVDGSEVDYQEWMEENDELIERTEKLRKGVFELAEVGIGLIIIGLGLRFAMGSLLLLFFIILIAGVEFFFRKFQSVEVLKRPRFKVVGQLIIFFLLLTPLRFFQNMGFNLSLGVSLFLSLAALGLSFLYLREEIIDVARRLYRRYLSLEIDGWGYR